MSGRGSAAGALCWPLDLAPAHVFCYPPSLPSPSPLPPHLCRARFHSLSQSSNTGNNIFYSFNVQQVHYLVFSAEAYLYARSEVFLANQLDFMEKDLAAVDRAATPWVVALVHKDWTMEAEAYAAFAPILNKGGVDILFCGVRERERERDRRAQGRGPPLSALSALCSHCDCPSLCLALSPSLCALLLLCAPQHASGQTRRLHALCCHRYRKASYTRTMLSQVPTHAMRKQTRRYALTD